MKVIAGNFNATTREATLLDGRFSTSFPPRPPIAFPHFIFTTERRKLIKHINNTKAALQCPPPALTLCLLPPSAAVSQSDRLWRIAWSEKKNREKKLTICCQQIGAGQAHKQLKMQLKKSKWKWKKKNNKRGKTKNLRHTKANAAKSKLQHIYLA